MKRSRLQKSLTMSFPIAGTKRCSGAARFNLCHRHHNGAKQRDERAKERRIDINDINALLD